MIDLEPCDNASKRTKQHTPCNLILADICIYTHTHTDTRHEHMVICALLIVLLFSTLYDALMSGGPGQGEKAPSRATS